MMAGGGAGGLRAHDATAPVIAGNEAKRLGEPPVEDVHTGRELELAGFQTEPRTVGTIWGDQVAFEHSGSGAQFDDCGKVRGMVISPDRAALAETAERTPSGGGARARD